MKKLLIAFLIAFLLVSVGFAVNRIGFKRTAHLPLCIRQRGGGNVTERGFGLRVGYRAVSDPTSTGESAHSLGFDPLGLIVCLAGLTALVYGLIALGGLILGEKA